LVWVAIIIASGAGWNPFSAEWDFSNTGAFGDSFGPLSAVMAGIAAYSAIAAFRAQQFEIERLKSREIDEEKSKRKSEFEGTFFQLMRSFQNIVSETDIHSGNNVKSGRDAFKSMMVKLSNEVARTGSIQRGWMETIEYYKNDLNHYFRYMYHVVSFVDQSNIDNKYFYVRLLRAALSDSELTFLALNCGFGEGRIKFSPLVEKYALLHNISDENRKKWQIDSIMPAAAFGRKDNYPIDSVPCMEE